MERTWTDAQLNAIESRHENLLLSAAAGSGKTAVLTERLIRRLIRDTQPLDVRRILVVTFTRSAAEELRCRIRTSLNDALKKDPANRSIRHQLLLLPEAQISTIHSFCLQLIRSNLTALGLPPGMRLADESEALLLKKEVMQELVDAVYEGECAPKLRLDFEVFVSHFTAVKTTEALTDILIENYNKMLPLTGGIELLTNSCSELQSIHCAKDFWNSKYGQTITAVVKTQFEYFKMQYEEILPLFCDNEILRKNYEPAFRAEYNFIGEILYHIENRDTDKLCKTFLCTDFPELGRGVKKEHISDRTEECKKIRTAFLDAKKTLYSQYFSIFSDEFTSSVSVDRNVDSSEPDNFSILGFEENYERFCREQAKYKNKIEALSQASACLLHDLYVIYTEFEKRLLREKKERNLMDFSDVEIYAKQLLWDDKEQGPTALACSIQERFDEIYIDEYQDINPIQELIFSMISNGSNRFMVGDIKQSIYGFRGASADIFDQKRKLFTSGDGGRLIFLSNNFRSDHNIIDFTNSVCGLLFSQNAGDFRYGKEDDLICSKPDGISISRDVNVYIAESDDEEEESEVEQPAAEARFVAEKIQGLLGTPKDDGSPIEAKDIVILIRSAKITALEFEKALQNHKIAVTNSVTKSFFESAEILLMLNLLYTIDNPNRDIYLTGVLKSPLFGFNLDELIHIRKKNQEGSLYQALKLFCAETHMQKGEYFLKKLREYREKARALSTDQLIWYIFCDTGILSLVSKISDNEILNPVAIEQSRANLMMLYDYARRYEQGNFRGLYQFVSYMNDMIEENTKFDLPTSGAEENAVHIMSIHQSKGLEFPVCFLSNTGRQFNESDTRAPFLLNEYFGAAPKLCDETGLARYDTPYRNILADVIRARQRAEELRILYVAVTRAREQLFITAEKKGAAEYIAAATKKSGHVNPYAIQKCSSYLDLILLAYGDRTENIHIIQPEPYHEKDLSIPSPPIQTMETGEPFRMQIQKHLSFRYAQNASVKIPAKLTISKLYPGVLDEDEDGILLRSDEDYRKILKRRPNFLESDLPNSHSGAERGTATHTFMQFCDFERIKQNGVLCEIDFLKEHGFITAQMASLISVGAIERFLRSPLYRRIEKAKQIWREKRFNVLLPASDFSNDEFLKSDLYNEEILVQGVIDCFFEKDDGGICVVDYKTDYFRLSDDFSINDAKAALVERYQNSLLYYKSACEILTQKPVDELILYSFSLNCEIDILRFKA